MARLVFETFSVPKYNGGDVLTEMFVIMDSETGDVHLATIQAGEFQQRVELAATSLSPSE